MNDRLDGFERSRVVESRIRAYQARWGRHLEFSFMSTNITSKGRKKVPVRNTGYRVCDNPFSKFMPWAALHVERYWGDMRQELGHRLSKEGREPTPR